jgi:hypothetical protein
MPTNFCPRARGNPPEFLDHSCQSDIFLDLYSALLTNCHGGTSSLIVIFQTVDSALIVLCRYAIYRNRESERRLMIFVDSDCRTKRFLLVVV